MESTVQIVKSAKNVGGGDPNPEGIHGCYTCGTCDSACPVGAATGRLSPRQLVHKARLGRFEEMLTARDIWYCLACNRCSNLCPMTVNPAGLIHNLRREAVARGIASPQFLQKHAEILNSLPKIFWHAAQAILQGQTPSIAASRRRWIQAPSPQPDSRPIRLGARAHPSKKAHHGAAGPTASAACFTCRECSSACPVCLDPHFFEPLKLFRMVNLGQIEEALRSPSIWVCLDCQSCVSACSQGVKGALIVRNVQELAYKEGIVPRDFFPKWQQARKEIFLDFIHQIDRLLDNTEKAPDVESNG